MSRILKTLRVFEDAISADAIYELQESIILEPNTFPTRQILVKIDDYRLASYLKEKPKYNGE